MQAVQNTLASVVHVPSYPSLALHPWDTGTVVAEMQELLCAHGFKVRIDGDFGWKTEIAVKQFQKQRGLRIDGIVESETWAALRSRLRLGDRLLWQGKTGSDVVELQGLLRLHGYGVQRNGIFDTATKRAVIDFQQHHHLISNSVVGEATRQRLNDQKNHQIALLS